jgi:tungstate transport system permease protein
MALGHAAISSLDPAARETAVALGASRGRVLLMVAWEARYGLLAAVAAAGGRLIAEVGVSMILGGNIAGHTRSLTTEIARQTKMGNFDFAIALGIILLAMALALNLLLRYLQGRREDASGGARCSISTPSSSKPAGPTCSSAPTARGRPRS